MSIDIPLIMLNYYGDSLLDVMYGVKTAKEATDEVWSTEDEACSCGCDHDHHIE
ncbi:MAG: hypothetical protein FWE83_01575 [Oscillospiraceae bacterium]|nr:hypothetical protein [Oscillospiraceae bacterium]